MNVHITYKVHKTPDIEKDIQHLIDKLRKRLQVFRPELVHLKGIVEQSSAREGTSVSLNLRLPSGQMAVQHSAAAASQAVKGACDDLLQQVTRHKDLLRSSHKWRRRGHEQSERNVHETPFEQTLAAVQPPMVSSSDISSYVNANLARLERFVERELYFREAAEELVPDLVTKNEVVDEAIARALGEGSEKPERLALEPWLYRLAMQSLDDMVERGRENGPSVHLEDSARQPNVRASDEPELQFHQPDETLTEESIIADRRSATPEDIAYSDEMMALVQYALSGSKREDREAFILHGMEGFSVDEIAAITDRKPEAVSNSIAAAREHLRRTTPIAHRSAEKALFNAAAKD